MVASINPLVCPAAFADSSDKFFPKFILVLVKMFVNFFKLLVSLLIVAGLMAIYQVPLSVYSRYLHF